MMMMMMKKSKRREIAEWIAIITSTVSVSLVIKSLLLLLFVLNRVAPV